MINVAVIGLIMLFLLYCFRSDYQRGLCWSVFFLVLCPTNLSIELSVTLPSLTVHRFIVVLLFFAWLKNRDDLSPAGETPFLALIVLTAVGIGLATIFSYNFMVSFKRYLYFLVESALFFVIVASSLRKKEDVVRIFRYMCLGLAAAALLGIYEKYTGFRVINYFGSKLSYAFESHRTPLFTGDIISTYMHRILFGTAMSLAVVSSMFFSASADLDNRKKAFYWALSLLAAAALYFSLSRGPWLSLAVGLFVFALFLHKPMMKRMAVFGLLGLMVLVTRPGVLRTLEGYYTSTLDAGSLKGSSYRWRFQVMDAAVKYITSSGSVVKSFFGYGEGSHIYMDFEWIELSSGHYGDLSSWDNEFAIILFERGFVGLALTLAIYVIFFIRSFRYIRDGGEYSDLVILSLSGLGIIAFMKTNVSIFAPQLIYLEFLFLAAGGVITSKKGLAGGPPAAALTS